MSDMLYAFLKNYCRVALHFFFRKWQIQGVENIPAGPVILVPNHQNAFLDAVLVTCSSRVNPWFITRSDVFRKPAAKRILSKLKMLPVYRFRDGFRTLKQNDAILNECVNKINCGESILIFAEGNHGNKYQLRPLQKGVARIAFAVKRELNVSIVPVGIQYENSKGFRSRVLISFGKPIYINDIQKETNNSRELYDELLIRIKNSLQKLIIHIDDEFYNDKIQYLAMHRKISNDLVKQLALDQDILSQFPQQNDVVIKNTDATLVHRLVNGYVRINLFITIFLTRKLILDRIKDPQFCISVKFAAGIFLTPAVWLIQAYLLFLLTGSVTISAAYLISLPVTLMLTKDKTSF